LELEHTLLLCVTHAHQEGPELDSDSDFMVLTELISSHTVHEATLADSRVANDDQLEQVVLSECRRTFVGGGEDLVGDASKFRGLEVSRSDRLVVWILRGS